MSPDLTPKQIGLKVVELQGRIEALAAAYDMQVEIARAARDAAQDFDRERRNLERDLIAFVAPPQSASSLFLLDLL